MGEYREFDMRSRVLGINRKVPLLDGSLVTYVNLDNAASTPPLKGVLEAVSELMPYYSSVHRGTGFKSRLSTRAYDDAHEIIGEFVGADLDSNSVVFCRNTTEAINKVAHCMDDNGCTVLTTIMEHHSNDLPWRDHTKVIHAGATPEGRLDMEDFERKLNDNAGQIDLVAVTGASNVTGFLLPIYDLARMVHAAGASILIDCAQLAPHRRIDMKPDSSEEHLDFVVLSGHKMYAPFGAGALVGPTEFFLQSGPDVSGGGTVRAVTRSSVDWNGMPERGEAGSPNVPGAVAMAVAARTLMEVGLEAIAAHEEQLTRYALRRLKEVPDIVLYGETSEDRCGERVGVIPFNVEGVYHCLLAAVLSYEGGIGVRSGCFCAHPYVQHLMGMSDQEVEAWRRSFVEGDERNLPGLVRMSFGCYSNTDDVDRMVDKLHQISRGEYSGVYVEGEDMCSFVPQGFEDDLDDYFTL